MTGTGLGFHFLDVSERRPGSRGQHRQGPPPPPLTQDFGEKETDVDAEHGIHFSGFLSIIVNVSVLAWN